MAAKNGAKNNFYQTVADDSLYTLWVKNFVGIALSGTVSKMNTFLHFHAEFQDGHQKWRESNF